MHLGYANETWPHGDRALNQASYSHRNSMTIKSCQAFCSANNYAEGSSVEVATPYSSRAPNIFAPARIVSYKKCPENTHTEYGLAYIV